MVDDLSILDNLSLSEDEMSLIKTEISAGRIINIPEEGIAIQQWKGTGYIYDIDCSRNHWNRPYLRRPASNSFRTYCSLLYDVFIYGLYDKWRRG